MDVSVLSSKLAGYLGDQFECAVTVENLFEVTGSWETELFMFQAHYEDAERVCRDLVLRVFSGVDAEKDASKEFYLMTRLAEVGYPVPKVHFLEAGSVLGKPFILMTRIPGETLNALYQVESTELVQEGVSRLMELLYTLHRLDPSSFIDVPYLSSFDQVQRYLDTFTDVQNSYSPWISPVVDWLKHNKPEDSNEYQSLCHMDFHGMNVILDEEDKPSVIDWGASRICDHRLDLGLSTLLYNTYDGAMSGAPLVGVYESLGGKVDGMRFFEVVAATRRITGLLKVVYGGESVNMKPGLEGMMRGSKDHYIRVHDFLEKRTGIRLGELDALLKSF